MYVMQAAIQQSIEEGNLVVAGWIMVITALLLTSIGMAISMWRREKFRYWKMISTLLILGLAAMSGLLDEMLKIVAGKLE